MEELKNLENKSFNLNGFVKINHLKLSTFTHILHNNFACNTLDFFVNKFIHYMNIFIESKLQFITN